MCWDKYRHKMTCLGKHFQNGEDRSDSAVIAEMEVDQSHRKWVDYALIFILKSTFATFKCVRYDTPFLTKIPTLWCLSR